MTLAIGQCNNCPPQESGDLRSLAPPVPIPNTEVKRAFADGSASIGCARVGRCQYHEPRRGKPRRGFFLPERWRWTRTEVNCPMPAMERYQALRGDTGVSGYHIGRDSIEIQFRDKSVYLYTYASTGKSKVEVM